MVAKIGTVGIIITAMAVAVLGGISFSVLEQDTSGIEYFELAFAKDFELTYDAFQPSSSVLIGNKMVFLTPDTTSTGSITPNTISVVDTTNGALLYKIENPRQDVRDDWFGDHIEFDGNSIATGSVFLDPDTEKWSSQVRIFDGNTGDLVYTIDNPIPENLHFGYAFEYVKDHLAVYSGDEDPNEDYGNMVHVFDTNDGSLLYTIDDPHNHRDFGRGLAAFDDMLLVSVNDFNSDEAAESIYSFDIKDGQLLYTIENPLPHGDFYGQALITNDILVVRTDNAMSVYDVNTGELLHTEDGFPTTNSELQMILYSIGDDGYGDSFFVLVVMVTIGLGVLGIVLFKKMKK